MSQAANPDKVFDADLSDHLDAEARHEKRVESIALHAKLLMAKGQECYPWTFDHFEEAMANAPEGGRRIVWTYIAEAVEKKTDKLASYMMAMELLKHMVETYWEFIAVKEAEKHFASL